MRDVSEAFWTDFEENVTYILSSFLMSLLYFPPQKTHGMAAMEEAEGARSRSAATRERESHNLGLYVWCMRTMLCGSREESTVQR